MGAYQVDVGSAAVAEHLAKILLQSSLPGFGALPGEVRHVGGGILELDELAMGSLRVRKVHPLGDGEGEYLTVDGQTWPVLLAGLASPGLVAG